jgi:hypothetical protein
MSSTYYFWWSGVELVLLEVNPMPISKLICGIDTWLITMYGCFLIKLKNWDVNCSSSLFANFASLSCLPCFWYIWMSSANPSVYDAIEELAHVRPRCSSVLRAALSWSFWRCCLNLPTFSLVTRSLAFLITLVISEFEVTNCLLSSVRDRPWIQFFHAQRTTFKGIQYLSLAKLMFLLCP